MHGVGCELKTLTDSDNNQPKHQLRSDIISSLLASLFLIFFPDHLIFPSFQREIPIQDLSNVIISTIRYFIHQTLPRDPFIPIPTASVHMLHHIYISADGLIPLCHTIFGPITSKSAGSDIIRSVFFPGQLWYMILSLCSVNYTRSQEIGTPAIYGANILYECQPTYLENIILSKHVKKSFSGSKPPQNSACINFQLEIGLHLHRSKYLQS